MEKAKVKRSIIISIYIFLFLFLALAIVIFSRPSESCFDGVQNQNEQGIDCGGRCEAECKRIEAQPLAVEEYGGVAAGVQGRYDFYAKISNPNATFGNQRFSYRIALKDQDGQVLAERSSSSFILPGERKYVIESNIESPRKPDSYEFSILDSDWIEFNDYYKKPGIQVVNRTYNEVSGGGFSEAKGLVKNESEFDFGSLAVNVILKDGAGSVLALNSTRMNTIRSGESRDFRVFWPSSFPGVVANMEAQIEVDVFDSDTFLKTYYKAEKFQQY